MLRRGAPAGALFALVLAAPAGAQGKARIAVLAFENNTTSNLFGDKLGAAASDEVTTQLVKTGEFSVIERRQIESILAEQKLGMSGLVDAATAAKVGKLLGAQLVVVGSITKFSLDRKSGGIRGFSATFTEAESAIDARMIDTSTGEILIVASGNGTKRLGGAAYKDINLERNFDAGVAGEALRPAVEQTIKKFLEQKDRFAKLAAKAPLGQIVGVRGADFYIDRGENAGVKVGQRFEVVRVVDQIKDASGNVLDEITDKVGVIEVTRVLSQSAIAKVVDGQARQGDKLRPVQ